MCRRGNQHTATQGRRLRPSPPALVVLRCTRPLQLFLSTHVALLLFISLPSPFNLQTSDGEIQLSVDSTGTVRSFDSAGVVLPASPARSGPLPFFVYCLLAVLCVCKFSVSSAQTWQEIYGLSEPVVIYTLCTRLTKSVLPVLSRWSPFGMRGGSIFSPRPPRSLCWKVRLRCLLAGLCAEPDMPDIIRLRL